MIKENFRVPAFPGSLLLFLNPDRGLEPRQGFLHSSLLAFRNFLPDQNNERAGPLAVLFGMPGIDPAGVVLQVIAKTAEICRNAINHINPPFLVNQYSQGLKLSGYIDICLIISFLP
jgi:hypothetical protein